MKKIRLLSLFSGIGAFEKALTNVGIDYELVASSEWDIYPTVAYNAIHHKHKGFDKGFDYPNKKEMINYLLKLDLSKEGKKPCSKDYIKRLKGNKLKGIYKAFKQSNNLGSIKTINPNQLPKNIDLITHGSPCQDFSIAGYNKGGDEDSDTRSSLMWHTVEIVKKIKPKFVIWEQVPNVLSNKHKHNFDKYLDSLKQTGYDNHYKLLNAKDFGIAQNRKRVYVISIRKDVKSNFSFENITYLENPKVSLAYLEKKVKEKYFMNKKLKEKFKEKIKKDLEVQRKNFEKKSEEKILELGLLDLNTYEITKRLYSPLGISPTVSTFAGGHTETKFLVKGVYNQNDGFQIKKEFNTLDAHYYKGLGGNQNRSGVLECKLNPKEEYRIRKLTPLESFRFMGFEDEDYFKAKQAMENTFYNGNDRSDSRMYKMAGNSIVVPVLEGIFKELFNSKGDDNN